MNLHSVQQSTPHIRLTAYILLLLPHQPLATNLKYQYEQEQNMVNLYLICYSTEDTFYLIIKEIIKRVNI